MPTDSERALAIFVDFDNIAQGFRRTDRFDIQRVLKRMVEKGKIVAKKTYADWSRYLQYTASLHEAAFELVEIPKRSQTGKNSADIRLCVDAMDLAYNKPHIDTFVIVSGDSDFTPLVSKLKEMGKHVIGLGMMASTSELLRDNCDEFIYYEDLEEEVVESPRINTPIPEPKRKAYELLLEACVALRRENKEVLWASMIKETMKRKKPSFNETYHGFNTFSALLESAQADGLVALERDDKRGTYTVTRFGDELEAGTKKEPARKQSRTPVSSVSKTARGITPKVSKTVRGDETIDRPATYLPHALAPEENITPEPRYQGFSDFAQETSEFMKPPAYTSFEDEFADYRRPPPHRSAIGSTADEVMANLHLSRESSEKPTAQTRNKDSEENKPENVAGEIAENDIGKRKRRRGKGKERTEIATQEPAEQLLDDSPITFEDVPFTKPSIDVGHSTLEHQEMQHPDDELFSESSFGEPVSSTLESTQEKSVARQVFEEIQTPEERPSTPAASEKRREASPEEPSR
ncbi:MAG TPA: NYN domain-containing protein, partial [Gemmatales bacterium]|nr:NYN domain-containing protein [Gemmatales bacterium]